MATKTAPKSDKQLKITQIRSAAGSKPGMKETLTGLGLGKVNRTVVRDDIPTVRGMITKVHHLIRVEEAGK